MRRYSKTLTETVKAAVDSVPNDISYKYQIEDIANFTIGILLKTEDDEAAHECFLDNFCFPLGVIIPESDYGQEWETVLYDIVNGA